MSDTTHKEKLEFRTELKQLLHIITHSLYSHKEIFLRELISNASDAINKIKFDSINKEEQLEGNKDWKIKLSVDKSVGALTVSDNGVGMSRDHIIENLGTIAKSGTRAFLEQIRRQNQTQNAPDLIGQFGVGFYSAFMVADKVTVCSRMAGMPANQGVEWTSDGQGEFTVETVEKANRGTDVILHLKEDCKQFLSEWELRGLVRKFSNFIEHPVVMDVEKEDDKKNRVIAEEVLNARTALWLRSKSEITAEEYNAFYKEIANDFEDPARVIHYTAEGAQEFKVLLFIPSHRPIEFDWGEVKIGPRLYIQRVLVMDHCEELLPPYLRFVKGVVDSSDLPLNISRELLQQNQLLEQIQKNLVRSILDDLARMMSDDREKYVKFFRELGSVLKEGVGRDWSNRERVADLLLFESMKNSAGEYITLARYVEGMPADQKEIYYLTGESREQIEHSPYMEAFRARGQDVLLMTDPIDEFLTSSLGRYKDHPLKAVDRNDVAETGTIEPQVQAKFKGLLTLFKEVLEEVSEVRLSQRLKESASCLVAPEGSVSAHMERLMHRLGRTEAAARTKRILELNPAHPAIEGMRKLHDARSDDPRLEGYVRILYDEAVLAEGSRVKDAGAFARRINELMTREVGI